MDLSSFRRGMGAWTSRQAVRPDYRILVATLEAAQSASAAARALRSAGRRVETGPRHDGLVSLLLGEADWRDAVATQRGCFNPAAAASQRKPK